MNTPEEDPVEKCWREFWEPMFAREMEAQGKMLLQLIKAELYDFHEVMDRASKVYDHVTGGRISKVLTDSAVVCSLADEHYGEIFGGEK